jgi:hypothetical protein
MKVLLANNDQYEALNNYKNGVDVLKFSKDGEGNWVVGIAVLDYEPFSAVHANLSELTIIEYIMPED